ncbi:MAG: META domain-containing protein [Spirochaetaceae bacterium]|jgi:heat shock protein HslJ|nr:META domain-containing protein [Spirochaetaceae bacterium]
MKKISFCFTILVMTSLMMTACAGGPSQNKAPEFSGALGRDWQLVKIRTETGGINLDRTVMEAEGIGDAFTLQFEENQINGKALPNRYFGPYTRKGQSINFQGIASTLMASFKELDVLTEREYFDYLERVQSWAWNQDSLELHSSTPDGQKAILIFQ